MRVAATRALWFSSRKGPWGHHEKRRQADAGHSVRGIRRGRGVAHGHLRRSRAGTGRGGHRRQGGRGEPGRHLHAHGHLSDPARSALHSRWRRGGRGRGAGPRGHRAQARRAGLYRGGDGIGLLRLLCRKGGAPRPPGAADSRWHHICPGDGLRRFLSDRAYRALRPRRGETGRDGADPWCQRLGRNLGRRSWPGARGCG